MNYITPQAGAKEKKYIIHHEGEQFYYFDSLEEATSYLEYQERADKRLGVFTPGYYKIKETEIMNKGATYCRILPPVLPVDWYWIDGEEKAVEKNLKRFIMNFANEALAAAEAVAPDDRELAVTSIYNKFLNDAHFLFSQWGGDELLARQREYVRPSLELTRDNILKKYETQPIQSTAENTELMKKIPEGNPQEEAEWERSFLGKYIEEKHPKLHKAMKKAVDAGLVIYHDKKFDFITPKGITGLFFAEGGCTAWRDVCPYILIMGEVCNPRTLKNYSGNSEPVLWEFIRKICFSNNKDARH